MKNVPGWAIGAASVGVVVAAFFLGGRLAAADVSPATIMTAESPGGLPGGLQLECEPGQRAVLRQASLACVGRPNVPMALVDRYEAAPSAGYLQTVNRPTVARQAAPAQRAPVARAPVKAKRSTQKSVAIIAGSTAAGAVVGGVAKGKKGAVIGGIVGGAAATIWDQVTRRKN